MKTQIGRMTTMGTLSCFTVFLAATSVSLGQGTVYFINYAPGGSVDAPISDAFGNRIAGPSPYVADLFWSANLNSPMEGLIAGGFNAGFLSSTFHGGGYFSGGGRTLPLPGGQAILAQVRVWDTTFGPSYAQARDNGGEFGFSNLIVITPDTPPGSGAYLTGLQSFQLQVIPEPSSLALWVVAGGIFLLPFRKRAPEYDAPARK